jgi:hypothetical protein
MFELSHTDRLNLDELVQSPEFRFAVSTIQLYLLLDGEDLDAETEKHINDFCECNHYFESYAYGDNSYDNDKTYYMICSKCKFLLRFHYNRDGEISREIIINENVYAEF